MAILEKPIALDPGVGGMCIDASALQPADIIVSTTSAGVSTGIRVGTWSVVSHAALYAGDNQVVEAIGEGVTLRSLAVSLADDVLAVAYRMPALESDTADQIVQYARAQVGTPYSVAGALLSSDAILCRLVGPRPATFFCSQLVAEAFRHAGRPLLNAPSQCVTPDDVATIGQSRLHYVGHLKGNAAWLPVVSP